MKIKIFKSKSKQKPQAGFTFIEVLVAVVIVASVLTALGSMMALSMRVAEANEMEQLAQLKGQQVLEFFRKERLVKGWNSFYSNLDSGVYCVSTLPAQIEDLKNPPYFMSCYSSTEFLNHFYYTIEAVINKTDTIQVVVNVYRYSKGGTQQIGTGEFFTVEQTFKQY